MKGEQGVKGEQREEKKEQVEGGKNNASASAGIVHLSIRLPYSKLPTHGLERPETLRDLVPRKLDTGSGRKDRVGPY